MTKGLLDSLVPCFDNCGAAGRVWFVDRLVHCQTRGNGRMSEDAVDSPSHYPTVLLIDANKADRTYWATKIKQASPDYVVLEAENGESGLALYKSHQVDCVVLELDLPDMSGFQILVQLVPRVRYPSIAVVVLSRLIHTSLAQLAKTNGAQAYLTKSRISGDDLAGAIRKAIAAIGPTDKDAPL